MPRGMRKDGLGGAEDGSELLPFSRGAQLMTGSGLRVNLAPSLGPDPKQGNGVFDTALEVHTKDKEQRDGLRGDHAPSPSLQVCKAMRVMPTRGGWFW